MDKYKVLRLRDLKRQIKGQQAALKEAESCKRALESQIMEELDTDGSSLTRTDYGTVSIITEDLPQVIDWPAVEQYMKDNNALYLFQRRLSSPAWRDECTAKGLMPGTELFTKRKLSFTNKTT